MKLFVGLERTDYQDFLRAIGHYLDEHHFTSVRLFETEDGIVVQGVPRRDDGTTGTEHESYLLTEEDLQVMLRAAYQRRAAEQPESLLPAN